jgi:hypothetical protein
VQVAGRLDSIVPVERFELWSNGGVVKSVPLTAGGKHGELTASIQVTRSGWYTLRGTGSRREFPVDDLYVVGETSPVYVYCGDQPIRSREDAEYFIRWIDDITRQAEAHPGWRSDRERQHVLDQFAEARRVFEQRR